MANNEVIQEFKQFLNCLGAQTSYLYTHEISDLFTIDNAKNAYKSYHDEYKKILNGKQKKNGSSDIWSDRLNDSCS